MGLSPAFQSWVAEHNLFLNSLVDRIVTGYPEEAERYFDKWGHQDRLLNTAEPYYFWAIEGDPSLESRLPLRSAGLQVSWVSDLTPYQVRKVRILNGTHTLMASIGLLHGLNEVKEMTESPVWGDRIRNAMLEEIVPGCLSRRKKLQHTPKPCGSASATLHSAQAAGHRHEQPVQI